MEKTSEELYRERIKRIEDAIQLREPDMVPFAPLVTYFPVRYAGLNYEEAMHDYDKLAALAKKFIVDFKPDVLPEIFRVLSWAPTLEILDYKQLVWPGHGGKPDVTHQFIEGEYMTVDEYDEFLIDPSDFIIRKFLPRVYGSLAPLSNLFPVTRAYYNRMVAYVAQFGKPEVAGALESLIKAGQEAQKMSARADEYYSEMAALGLPRQFTSMSSSPFDYIGDYLRGTRGVMLDMYRNPDKLLEAIDRLLPSMIGQGISFAKVEGPNRVMIPLHKGLDGFMSPEQFKTFYWPSLKKLMLALIDAGYVPNPLWEGDCTSRLEIIGDMPKGKAVYWFERTNLVRAKEVIGDTICIEGGVPSSIMIAGTPDEVKKYCKRLIDVVGKDGGFIMNGDVGIPDEARVENVRALADFVREYGKYR